MSTLSYPFDIGSNPEHQHVFFLRTYMDESTSLGGSSRGGGESMSSVVSAEVQKLSSNMEFQRRGASRGGSIANDDSVKIGISRASDTERGSKKAGKETASAQAKFKQEAYDRATGGIKGNVILPFPHSISMSDGWTWETVSFQRTALGETVTGNFAAGTQKLGSTVAGLGGRLIMENADKLVAHKMGRVTNPRKETMFQEPEQRQYSFSWDFTPRNQKDSDSLNEIIKFLKYSSAPAAYKDEHALYHYPSEYQPFFLSNGKENNILER